MASDRPEADPENEDVGPGPTAEAAADTLKCSNEKLVLASLRMRNLLEESDGFRLLVESVKDYAIFMLDSAGFVKTWNPGAQRIKGYAPAEILGKHFSIFYPAEDAAAGKCERELEIAEREGRFEDEGWRIRRDGSRFWANVVITALRDSHGRLVGFGKVTRDLTSRVEAEEQRVQRARAEERERRKEEFLAIMGHELRNPLSPMVTALHLIKLRRGVGCDKEFAILDRQIAHLTRLLDDILDLSRTLRGHLSLSPTVIEIADVLAGAVEAASPLIREKRQRLVIDVAPTGLLVAVDVARMGQVFGNVLTNAAKYTDTNGEIRIRAMKRSAAIELTIEDTGVGIAPDVLPRVFDLFAQGKQGIERGLGGLGIGLAIAHHLVVEHGGEITAQSEGAGKGSRFTIRLPLAEAVGTSDQAPQSALRQGSARKRVLVVDDHQDSTELLQHVIEALGHEARVAFDGPHALEIAHEFSPDIVFLDIGLPGLSGYEVATRMRRIPACSEIPIVAVSGYARETDRRKAIEAGFSDHFAKPLDPAVLERLIEASPRN